MADAGIRQFRLQYSVRGPEWGFAVPQGDLGALEDVMQRCCGFWNGINSLIVPVRTDGRTPSSIRSLLAVRGIDQLFVHPQVGDRTFDALARNFPGVSRLRASFDDHEMHPLYLATNWPHSTMAEPSFEGARLNRIKLATWGAISETDRPHYEGRFNMHVGILGSHHRALLDEQQRGSTPLSITSRYMTVFYAQEFVTPCYLWVFRDAGFNELVEFWNARSRMADWSGRPQMIGVAREVLGEPNGLTTINDWLASPRAETVKPDLMVCAHASDHKALREALGELDISEYTGNLFVTSLGGPPDGVSPEYVLGPPILGGIMKRGTSGTTTMTITPAGVSLSVPVPEPFRPVPGGTVHLELHNLPLPLPANDHLAQAVLPAARCTLDGIGFGVLSTAGSWELDIKLPEGWEALGLWSQGRGYGVAVSQPGRYAQALLGRLEDYGQLDVLASDEALAVLHTLSPLSAKKFAQHLAARSGNAADRYVETLVDVLRKEPLWMELQARTLGELLSVTKLRKPDVLAALGRLTDAGLVLRGRSLRCPHCNFPDWIPLRELDERLRCNACNAGYPLPATDPGGTREAEAAYRLDGLMARCVDQDLLPVLLSMRFLLRLGRVAPTVQSRQSWPALELTKGERTQEIDLLISTGAKVTIFECKAQASSMHDKDAKKLVHLAHDLEAIPTAAALDGEFQPSVRKIVEAGGGNCLEHRHLLEAP